jgi:hypothetical protein
VVSQIYEAATNQIQKYCALPDRGQSTSVNRLHYVGLAVDELMKGFYCSEFPFKLAIKPARSAVLNFKHFSIYILRIMFYCIE